MRTKHYSFIRNDGNRDPEIVKWTTLSIGAETRYTLLWYRKDSEGWRIEFIGDRPLKEEHQTELFELMRYGQTVLDAEFHLLETLA